MKLALDPGPDEDERQAAVRAWNRAIQITVDLGVEVLNSEFNGRPEDPEYAGIIAAAAEKVSYVHLADTLDHTAANGLRYIVNRPAQPPRCTSMPRSPARLVLGNATRRWN